MSDLCPGTGTACRYVVWAFHIRALSTPKHGHTTSWAPSILILNRNLSFRNESPKKSSGSGYGDEAQNETRFFPLILEVFSSAKKKKVSETVEKKKKGFRTRAKQNKIETRL